tara:strand:+ start:19905 stop:20111 length:207 start_codon:yes stop_codon:yes gene_type:complete
MTSSYFPDHQKDFQFSKSGIPLHMLDDIQYQEFAMEFPNEIKKPIIYSSVQEFFYSTIPSKDDPEAHY